MKIFVAASYSSKVNYNTGEVSPEHKAWLESMFEKLEILGHTPFCALRADGYKINSTKPAEAFSLDIGELKRSDAILALLGDKVSAGVQTEIGVAIALGKKVILAHYKNNPIGYFNNSMLQAGLVSELLIPFTEDQLADVLK